MTIQRILILQSVQDVITDQRRQRIESDLRLANFEFEHFYVIELSDSQKQIPVPVMMSQIFRESLDGNLLETRLNDQIQVFAPDLVIVFYGGILGHYAFQFMRVLHSIKEQFPRLVFGIAHPSHPPKSIPYFDPVFDQSIEIQELVEKIFPLDRSIIGPVKFSRN